MTAADVPAGAADPAAALTGHVIVCGLPGLGLRVVEQLREAHVDVVVVDDDPSDRLLDQVRRWDVPFLRGSVTRPETLAQAGIDKALALIVALDSELETLETALLARRMRRDIRIVVAMANRAVGDALRDIDGEQVVLDIAELAAPSLVRACLRDPVQELGIPGERFVATRVEAASSGTLRELYGDLSPVGVVATNGTTEICPGRDHRVTAGDQVVMVGTADELVAHGVPVHEHWQARAIHPWRLKARMLRRIGRSVLAEADTAFRTTLAAAVVLIAFCATILWAFYDTDGHGHLDPLKAVYFSLATIVTVGFGDYNFGSQSDPMVVFGIFMILAGAVTFTTLVALLTNLLVSRRLAGSIGRTQASRMSGHVLVVGLGTIGVRVVQGLLDAGREVAVVERDDDNRFLAQVRALGVPVIIGDATLDDTLRAGGLPRARSIAVLTSDDMVNIEAGLVARQVLGDRYDDVPLVMRVFDRMLGRMLHRAFDFQSARSTAELTAPWFVGAALGLDVLSSFPIAREQLLLGRMRVAPGSGLDGVAMGELSSRTRVIAIERSGGAVEHPPRRDTKFCVGDVAYIVGSPAEVIGVLRR